MSTLEKLKSCHSLDDIADLLGYKPHILSFILYKIPADEKYTTFTIPKKSGGMREINCPISTIMALQRKLKNLLDECVEEIDASKKIKRPLSHAFKKKCSIVTNAYMHKNKRHVLNLDLDNFFPSINFGRVRGFFIKDSKFSLDSKIATVLAQIICHKNQLPQGSPCSPLISNMVGNILDIRLVRLAKATKCTYSRYADDLSFSTNLKDFPIACAFKPEPKKHIWKVGGELEKEIIKAGFAVNSKKTRIQYKNSRQDVTGLVVNKKVNIKSEYYKTVRSMCHALFMSGAYYHKSKVISPVVTPVADTKKDELSKRVQAFLQEFVGKIAANVPFLGTSPATKNIEIPGTTNELAGMLSHIYYVKHLYENRLDKRDRKDSLVGIKKLYFRFLFYINFRALEKPLIICEGKTDNIYLKCAIKNIPEFQGILVDYEMVNSKKKQERRPIYKIRFFNYSHITHEILQLSGGASGFVNFINNYKKHMTQYKIPKPKYPVILLIDNDDGGNSVFNAISNRMGTKQKVMRDKPFYWITDNLYVVPTPITPSVKNSKIEDFFDQKTLAEQINGKSFNPIEATFDRAKEYGKTDFAEKIVRQKQKEINFSRFKEILSPIMLAVDDYTKRQS